MRGLLVGLLGASGVAAGAFGAHGLKDIVAPERLVTWETAARYHIVHAVVLLVLLAAFPRARLAPGLFVAGISVFSGSLYGLVLLDQPRLGALTPVGGLLFLAGWLAIVPLLREPRT